MQGGLTLGCPQPTLGLGRGGGSAGTLHTNDPGKRGAGDGRDLFSWRFEVWDNTGNALSDAEVILNLRDWRDTNPLGHLEKAQKKI